MLSKPLRTGILGCGRFAQEHATVLAGLSSVELVAFCNRTRSKAEDFNRRFAHGQGQVYEEHHQMFDRADLDLVYICLPPFAHTDEVMEAARHGVHIFIEKPIALDSVLAWQMVEAVETAAIKSQVGFLRRFGDAVEYVKRCLETGEAGPPAMLLGRYYCNTLSTWWWRDRSKSGGQVVEQVIHHFDLMRYLLGEPRQISARFSNLFHAELPNYTSEDISSTTVTFANDALGTIVATNCAIPSRVIKDMDLVTRNLTVSIEDPNHATIVRTDRAWDSQLVIASDKDLLLAETLDLIEAIRENRPTRIPMREGARSLDLVLAARRSADEGRQVIVPEDRIPPKAAGE